MCSHALTLCAHAALNPRDRILLLVRFPHSHCLPRSGLNTAPYYHPERALNLLVERSGIPKLPCQSESHGCDGGHLLVATASGVALWYW